MKQNPHYHHQHHSKRDRMRNTPLTTLNSPALFTNAIRRARRLAGRVGNSTEDQQITLCASMQNSTQNKISKKCQSQKHKKLILNAEQDVKNPNIADSEPHSMLSKRQSHAKVGPSSNQACLPSHTKIEPPLKRACLSNHSLSHQHRTNQTQFNVSTQIQWLPQIECNQTTNSTQYKILSQRSASQFQPKQHTSEGICQLPGITEACSSRMPFPNPSIATWNSPAVGSIPPSLPPSASPLPADLLHFLRASLAQPTPSFPIPPPAPHGLGRLSTAFQHGAAWAMGLNEPTRVDCRPPSLRR
jgi:hypothetical protein